VPHGAWPLAERACRAGFPRLLIGERRIVLLGSVHAFASGRRLTPFPGRTYDDCGAVKALTTV